MRLRVAPDGVGDLAPAGAVLAQRVPDHAESDSGTWTSLWGTFCHHNHFFPDRRRAERWAAGRHDIAILFLVDDFTAAGDVAAA